MTPKQRDRDERAERAGPVEEVDLRRKHLDQVRQRQPDRADLLPARRDVVDDAARHHEVRFRVVVGEDEVRAQEDDPRNGARGRGRGREQPGVRSIITRRAQDTLKSFISWLYGVALSLGGPGLFTIAFLDSSFISLPQINDILVVLMVTQNKALMPYYAVDGHARLDRRLLRHLLPGREGR